MVTEWRSLKELTLFSDLSLGWIFSLNESFCLTGYNLRVFELKGHICDEKGGINYQLRQNGWYKCLDGN
ncbi:hypothetical protein HanXRQr2_Chr05g0205681 [Helianthus annuus]|uniref:Uncharacterized protein n=1 Tax=Helianthus annuus TaxID=4232 RepID=A0A251UNV7_HELAN|nr:hypothetical protein HanXRQr2_Chr05g0205681 [Helianthus annuus]KAJ0922012.1 hypothetical protein HanPSC8_Chr05g0198521 [Helianthus annuus]